MWLPNSCSAVRTCLSRHWRVALSCLALLYWGLINMHFLSSFPAPLGLRYASHKHFTATFSCSNAYSSDDKANVNAAFRHFLRCIVLHLCPTSVERRGKKKTKIEEEQKLLVNTLFGFTRKFKKYGNSLGGKGNIPLLWRKHYDSCFLVEPDSLQKKQVGVKDCEV